MSRETSTTADRRRTVITGMGAVTPLGVGVAPLWTGLLAGTSGIGPITQFDATNFRVRFGGQIPHFDAAERLGVRAAKRLDRFSQFGMVAALEAVADSGLAFDGGDPSRLGVALGSSVGGLTEFEEQHDRFRKDGPGRLSPLMIPRFMPNAAAGAISIHFGLQGPSITISTACASANQAIEHALRVIQLDQADVMLAGGAEAALTPMALGGFCAARALSTRNDDPTSASRPFDRDRDGFVLGEGAGVLVLEELAHARRRGARIYAELLGAGTSSDAHHITAPDPQALGARRAMQLALADSRLNPTDINYVNAHGTGTLVGDACETLAVKQVFGQHAQRLAVNSTKSMIGHLCGSTGAVELIVASLSIRDGVVHPTINYQTPDPDCDLDYVPDGPRQLPVAYAISNSFGFGGHNCSLVIGKFS